MTYKTKQWNFDCPCIQAEKPLCAPDCWHFGNNKSWCRNCGEGDKPTQQGPVEERK